MEKTVEYSKKQAEIINMIAIPIVMLDEEYCRSLAKDMVDQANRQMALSVLNPRYPQSKNELILLQAKALRLLCDYVGTLKEIDKIKQQVAVEEKSMADIDKLFL